VIDELSLDKYRNHTGIMAEKLKGAVDYEEQDFRQDNSRCRMLNESGLCDLQAAMGEDFLCDTCRLYPRHIEEFQDLREYSLSLSCPEVTRKFLKDDYEFSLREYEDEEEDDPDDFEDFDFLIFDQLEYARDKMFETASDKGLPLQERLSRIASAAYRLQELFDEGDVLEMGNVSLDECVPHKGSGILPDHDYMVGSLDILIGMEVLESSWRDGVREAKEYWSERKESSEEWKSFMNPDEKLGRIFENMLKSLLFTYFCGAVYDGQIYARAMIAVQSIRWMMMLYLTGGKELAPTVYLYSREVEHSDNNINALISAFEDELE
jgi:lysine-N-methylase